MIKNEPYHFLVPTVSPDVIVLWVFLAIEVDIHHNFSIGIREEDLWRNSESVVIHGGQVKMPAAEVLAWFLAARFYHEVMVLSERKAKLLGDLLKVIESRRIDWSIVRAAAETYSLAPGMFYVMRFLREVIDIDISKDIIAGFGDGGAREQRSYHDWGDFLPKLLDIRVVIDLPDGMERA